MISPVNIPSIAWKLCALGTLCLGLSLSTNPVFADSSQGPVSTSRFGNVAIGGHDTVAYHNQSSISEHRATEGSKKWVHEWRDATWRFADEDSYNKFQENPQKYQPAYGGYCANALSSGEGLVRTDGTHWQIFGDELYLFYAAGGRQQWLDGDIDEYRQTADRAWKEITGFANQ